MLNFTGHQCCPRCFQCYLLHFLHLPLSFWLPAIYLWVITFNTLILDICDCVMWLLKTTIIKRPVLGQLILDGLNLPMQCSHLVVQVDIFLVQFFVVLEQIYIVLIEYLQLAHQELFLLVHCFYLLFQTLLLYFHLKVSLLQVDLSFCQFVFRLEEFCLANW